MSDVAKPTELLPLVTDIVAAHLSNNNVPSAELPQLIREVYHALAMASTGGPAPTARPEPAVSVKKSITPDYIVCLEDGKKLKMLKRHLRTSYDMSPEQYREISGLIQRPGHRFGRPRLASGRGEVFRL